MNSKSQKVEGALEGAEKLQGCEWRQQCLKWSSGRLGVIAGDQVPMGSPLGWVAEVGWRTRLLEGS